MPPARPQLPRLLTGWQHWDPEDAWGRRPTKGSEWHLRGAGSQSVATCPVLGHRKAVTWKGSLGTSPRPPPTPLKDSTSPVPVRACRARLTQDVHWPGSSMCPSNPVHCPPVSAEQGTAWSSQGPGAWLGHDPHVCPHAAHPPRPVYLTWLSSFLFCFHFNPLRAISFLVWTLIPFQMACPLHPPLPGSRAKPHG